MNDFVSLNKQSKKLQKQFHAKNRGSWNGINPVSRIVPNKKAYNRKKLPKKFDSYLLYAISPCIIVS